MTYNEMSSAVTDAEQTLRLADTAAAKIARLLVGRLHKAGENYNDRETLVKLKRELQDFDAGRKLWREEKS